MLTYVYFTSLEYNVTTELANYMLMVMNPSSGILVNFLNGTDWGPSLIGMLNYLKNELDSKMKEHGFDQLSDLFKALAIE